MNSQIIAIIFQEGGKLISEFLKTRSPKRSPTVKEPDIDLSPEELEETTEEKSQSVEAGCVPCAIGHLGTCSGLLSESMRFARKDGISSGEVIDRANLCLDELNAMERVDLRPELIVKLPLWEKELANRALMESRTARHGLESLSTAEDLERITANLQSARQDIGRAWFKQRIAKMPKEEKAQLAEKAIEKLEKEE